MGRPKSPFGAGNLTPEQKLQAGYWHLIRGVDQHIIAEMFQVNPGRVAEAVKSVRSACGIKSPREESVEPSFL